MLRVRPKDQGRQDRIHEAAPDGDARDVVFCSIILRYEDDVANDVDDSEQHV